MCAALVKPVSGGDRNRDLEIEQGIRQIISRAVVSDRVVDLFAAAGLKAPALPLENNPPFKSEYESHTSVAHPYA